MKILRVFDPPMCCSTGVCGADVDANLVQFAADLEWLKARGVTVERFNLSHEPQAFMNEPEVLKAVSAEGTRCLPMLMMDGNVVSRDTYPTRNRLADLTGVAKTDATARVGERATGLGAVGVASASATCCTPSQGENTGCCSR